MRIIRVWYEYVERTDVKNTYVDFKLLDNQQNVKYVELLDIIPESVKVNKTFLDTS